MHRAFTAYAKGTKGHHKLLGNERMTVLHKLVEISI